MQLNERNKIGLLSLLMCAALLVASCETEPADAIPSEKIKRDSISKSEQKHRADSAKASNPLLILPPDSTYTGTYIDRYESGVVKFRGYFRFGQRHGQWLSFYPNGNAWSEMHYDKGNREGPNITYFDNGKIRYRGIYRNDQRDSIWVYYGTDGRVAERVVYKNDRIVDKLGTEKQ